MSNSTSIGGAEGIKWLSVEEAGNYLGVSRPTIFRWMKDGLLSFYKIGGSTRFSRESLDAVIEKTTGQKEAEAAAGRCACCGHTILIEGKVQGTGNLFFRPLKTRFWVFAEALVPLTARTCAACGYVQMHADTSKLSRLTKGKDMPAPIPDENTSLSGTQAEQSAQPAVNGTQPGSTGRKGVPQ